MICCLQTFLRLLLNAFSVAVRFCYKEYMHIGFENTDRTHIVYVRIQSVFHTNSSLFNAIFLVRKFS